MPGNRKEGSMFFAECRPSELEEIAAIVNSAYRGGASRAGWTSEADLLGGQRIDAASLAADLAAKPGATVLTMREREGGDILASVWLERADARRFYLGMLAVRPTLQAAGLGKALVAEAEARARAAGASVMRLTVIAQRETLIAWYERQGYARTGIVKPFPYHDSSVGEPKRADLSLVEFEKALRA
jgi:ribosomal protein S18 acetylase RimI-like enzyme